MFTLRSAGDIRRRFPHLPSTYLAGIEQFDFRFRFGISEETLGYLRKDENGVPLLSDPLARIYWPFPDLMQAKDHEADYGNADNWESPEEFPIVENSAWQWKYADRIVFREHRCVQYCLYCFESNRTMDKATRLHPRNEDWAEGIAFVRAHPEIREVIFSGGEPMVVSDRVLEERLKDVRSISSVRSVRIHTAKGVHDTDRLSEEFASLCARYAVTEIALHILHPRQVTERFAAAMRRLASGCGSMLRFAHIPILHGVNDDTEIVRELCVKLGEVGVKAYYALLEMPSTSGIKKSRVSVQRMVEIMQPLVNRHFVHMLAPEPIIVARGGKKTVPMQRTHFWLHRSQVQERVWAIDNTHQPLENFSLACQGDLFEFDGTPDFMYTTYGNRPVIVCKNWNGLWEMYPDAC